MGWCLQKLLLVKHADFCLVQHLFILLMVTHHRKGRNFLFPYTTARCPNGARSSKLHIVFNKFISAIGFWYFIQEILCRFPIYGDETIFRSACQKVQGPSFRASSALSVIGYSSVKRLPCSTV